MSENLSTLELIDFHDLLREENNRLIKQLLLAQKCIKLFENYRNCLDTYQNNCKCNQNIESKFIFNDLEKQYKSLVEEDMRNCGISHDEKTNICFNKKRKLLANQQKSDSQSIDNQFRFGSELAEDNLTTNQTNHNRDKNSNFENILSKKFGDSLKRLKDNDFKLMYIKNKDSNDFTQYKCNWFKCGTSFASESSLNQHIKTIHFTINSNCDHILSKTDCEKPILIQCGESSNETTRDQKPFVCDWVGCELRFKSELELERHQKSVHYCEKKHSFSRSNYIFNSGLKPLTIHTLGASLDLSEKEFKCDSCDRSYTRKDRLKSHMNLDHGSGDYNLKIYRCDECDYETKNGSHLKRHQIRKHTGEKPYKCYLGDCGLGFATSDQLKSHQINRHSDERPYKCDWPDCDSTFKLRKQLIRHYASHSKTI